MSQPLCQIEHHAVLYALLARGAVLLGKAGEKAIEKATIEYGLEQVLKKTLVKLCKL